MSGGRAGPALRATYRVQLHRGFPLSAARALVPYLAALGVSHLYASPLLQARRGSAHGYDTVDPTRVSAELGGAVALRALVRALRRHGMGLVVDIVPNHMGTGHENPFWQDVLARGRASRFAPWFDVDWEAAADGRILLPVLGDPLPAVLARGELVLERAGRGLAIRYFEARFPIDPTTIPAAARERAALRGACARDPDRLAALLARQPYALVHWRRATRAIGYRRFFDVNELIGVRQEDPNVWEATHGCLLGLVRAGWIDGLRIDHVDGLADPLGYLESLAAATRRRPLWVEKILSPGETLPRCWPVEGTTGYEFLGALDAIFLDPTGVRRLEAWYGRRIWPGRRRFADVALAGKQAVVHGALWPDVRRVARAVVAAAHAGGWSVPPLDAVHDAVAELIVALPVYRTYVDGRTRRVAGDDRRWIDRALRGARRRRRAAPAALGLLARLLRERPAGAASPAWLEAVRRLQQTSGPATAKGIEDTALYVYVPLASRNEVGGEPGERPERAVATLHATNAERARHWPRTLLCTGTHDTKRSADVRARLHVLSEMPGAWAAHVARWRRWNARHRSGTEARRAPDASTEYLVYQTLVGIWPLGGPPSARVRATLRERVATYMVKAAREAKVRTSWIAPDAAFETALTRFVQALVPTRPGAADRAFLEDLAALVGRIARPGLWTALARTLVHLTAPGVPDLYQGNVLWRFSLVDPDNRRPVDFGRRERLVAALDAEEGGDRVALVRRLVRRPEDGRVKLHLVRAALAVRRRRPGLFAGGSYAPLRAEGRRARHVFAYARSAKGALAVVVAPRLVWALTRADPRRPPIGPEVWKATTLRLPPRMRARRFTCALTGRRCTPGPGGVLPLAEVLGDFPGALLLA